MQRRYNDLVIGSSGPLQFPGSLMPQERVELDGVEFFLIDYEGEVDRDIVLVRLFL